MLLSNNNNMIILKHIEKTFADLFPLNRSFTGEGVKTTLNYIKNNFFSEAKIKKISSGTKVFDWQIPDEWNIIDGYVKNFNGEKIIDFKESNLNVISYSSPISKFVEKSELLKHLFTLPNHPNWVPYRTSYYHRNWGFCCTQKLVDSNKFKGPFEVFIDSSFNKKGELNWLEYLKPGKIKDEILISTYCCHPSLANDNLSGIVLAIYLFEYLIKLDTKFSYRLLIAPETIGAINFLSSANTKKILAGMILSCVAGPDKIG